MNHILIEENKTQWINISLYPRYNDPPEAPDIYGETQGGIEVEYEYTFKAEDPNNDLIRFFIDWGDDNTQWTEYVNSSEEVKINHTWFKKGTYIIKAKTQDIHMAESRWSTLEVRMPLSFELIITVLNQDIQQIMEINQEYEEISVLL